MMMICDAQIRPATCQDLDALAALERGCRLHPWTAGMFREELENRHAHLELLMLDGELAGYICYHLFLGELSVLNLATACAFRRRGVARTLLAHALAACGTGEGVRALLEVRVGNTAARTLYQKCGLRVIGLRKGYYSDGEDALVMAKDLSETVS